MKFLISYILLFLTVFSLYAQEDVEQKNTEDSAAKVKLTKEERKEIRKEAEFDYLTWERKYFNSPGKWYMSIEAGGSYPFLTTEPQTVPPLVFIGSSEYVEKANGDVINNLLLASQGGGIRMGFTVGKMFNRFVGMEVKLGYFKGDEDNLSTISRPKFNAVLNTTLSEFSITPSLVLQSPNMRNFYLVGKIGPYIPNWGNPKANVDIDDRDGSLIAGIINDPLLTPVLEAVLGTDFAQAGLELLDYRAVLHADTKIILQQYIEEYSFKELVRGIGVNASLGFRYQASPIISLYGDIAVRGFNISLGAVLIEDLYAKASILGGSVTILELTEEGGSVFGNPISKEQIKSLLETRYFNELDETSNNVNYNPDGVNSFNPAEELAPRLSVVSVGFNVGVQINFPGRDIYYREKSKKGKK